MPGLAHFDLGALEMSMKDKPNVSIPSRRVSSSNLVSSAGLKIQRQNEKVEHFHRLVQ